MNLETGTQPSRYVNVLRRFLPIIAFAIPLYILYTLEPASFELTWKGRTFYLFFIWLIILETILSWRQPRPVLGRFKPLKNAVLGIALVLPTVYVVAENYFGLNARIGEFAKLLFSGGSPDVALSIEYLVLSIMAIVALSLTYGISGLQDFPIAPLFLGAIGLIYMIDSLYPYGKFMPFQAIVPTTTQLSASMLNMLGYKTRIGFGTNPAWGSMSSLSITDLSGNSVGAYIAWGCSGIEGLIIYTITILLFLRRSPMPAWQKLTYFSVGAGVTYFMNALRIVSYYIIALANKSSGGFTSPAGNDFHYFYGPLYSVTWIMLYPILIIGLQLLANRMKPPKPRTLPLEKPA